MIFGIRLEKYYQKQIINNLNFLKSMKNITGDANGYNNLSDQESATKKKKTPSTSKKQTKKKDDDDYQKMAKELAKDYEKLIENSEKLYEMGCDKDLGDFNVIASCGKKDLANFLDTLKNKES